MIPPSGNTTFDVVFLGREEGPVENTLYIHTSAGSFRFNVKAKGTPNPYRLQPLVGVKLPINSSFSPLIRLHNPHPEPIQVLEMYSSGGDLHLELPDGETEGMILPPPFLTAGSAPNFPQICSSFDHKSCFLEPREFVKK